MIRVAGATFAFGDISLEESVGILKSLGFDLADVGAAGWSTFTAYVPQQVVKNIDDADGEAARIKKIMDDGGMGMSELFVCDFGVAINHPDQKERERSRGLFAKMAKIGGLAGFESIMMLPGNLHEDLGQTPEEAFQTSVEEYRWMVAEAEKNGLLLNFEPCIMSIAVEPENAIRLVEAVPGLRFTLDYAHQVQIGLGQEEIEVMHPYARHIHAKQSAQGHFEARPDEGVLDFGRMMRKLKADNYDGVVTIEFVSAPDVLEAGWDLIEETAKMKKVVEDALASA